jgi:glucose-6-phosphate isomerase
MEGANGDALTHVLALGIGGSSLGLLAIALRGEADGPQVRFCSNVDAAEFDDAIRGLDPRTTLVVIASKTFTTQETLVNALAAREWIAGTLGDGAIAKHFVAPTSNRVAAADFGLPECNVFPFADWVGGRYSLWSSVGFPSRSRSARSDSARCWPVPRSRPRIRPTRSSATSRRCWRSWASGIATR